MTRRLGRRLLWGLFVVWATVSLAFFVERALPSDAARMVAGPQAPPERVVAVRKELGLDRSLPVQYIHFFGHLVHFAGGDADAHRSCGTLGPLHLDLGRSFQQRRPVTMIVAERLPRTLLLGVAAALVQAIVGVTFGTIAAARKRRWLDHLAVSGSLVGVSAPTFVSGLLLQYVFAYRLRLLPLDGFGESIGDHLVSLVLPALTLGIFGAAYYTRLVRDEMIGQLSQDYIRTARAKGLPEWAVVVRHALRNALVPIVTVLGLEVGALVGGAIVTEQLFRWPGLGALSVNAMLDRDGPVIMGCVIVTACGVVLSTIAVDFVYAILDPRVRRDNR